MVELVMKGGGNRQCVRLIDVTEENHQINDTGACVEKKITGEDYALVCEHLFRNRGLSVGDEIELYWDTEFHKFIFKFCNSMVSESDFLDIHRCRSEEKKKKYGKASTLVLQVDGFDSLYNCVPTDPAYSCLDCVNGLFCDWDSSNMRPAAIFNPSTKEVRFLPDPIEGKCWNKYSLGFEPKENKYKVLLTTHLSRARYTKYEVFTLGIDKSWRDSQHILPCIPYYMPSVCISGVIYQFAIPNDLSIVAFDVKSEKIKIIALWIALELVYYYRLIEVKGKLGKLESRDLHHSSWTVMERLYSL
ncbi:putative F-box protein At5g52610 [Solanum stenotomum]|uniref:putative F-box protein At5g52610 n=1 Tax=Solanum stenotomum TaxID=172797 RepID=UPI0020D17B41|nr:putative F-box protein At5g52610 [Solanum stenotomum]